LFFIFLSYFLLINVFNNTLFSLETWVHLNGIFFLTLRLILYYVKWLIILFCFLYKGRSNLGLDIGLFPRPNYVLIWFNNLLCLGLKNRFPLTIYLWFFCFLYLITLTLFLWGIHNVLCVNNLLLRRILILRFLDNNLSTLFTGSLLGNISLNYLFLLDLLGVCLLYNNNWVLNLLKLNFIVKLNFIRTLIYFLRLLYLFWDVF
jgi:hypothetical protein